MENISILMGLPCSGKTHFINKSKSDGVNYFNHLSKDIIRKTVFDVVYDKKVEQDVHKIFMNQLKFFLSLGQDIVVDNTNLLESSRNRIIELANKHGYKINIVYISTNIKTCLKRAESRKNPELWKVVINKMNDSKELVKLSKEEKLKRIDAYTVISSGKVKQYKIK